LVPVDAFGLAVFQINPGSPLVVDVVLADNGVGGSDGNAVLVVALRFVEGEIQVDVFHVGQGGRCRGVGFRGVFGRERIGLHAVVPLVSLQYAGFPAVKVGAPVIVIIVTGRVVERREGVVGKAIEGFGSEFVFNRLHVFGHAWPTEFFFCSQTVKSDILLDTDALGVVEGVGGG